MKCENCGKEHDGTYGSGRFCSEKCARGFSTKKDRSEISRRVSISLGGDGSDASKCLYCGAQLKRRKTKFCSNAHSVRYFQEQTWKTYERAGKWIVGNRSNKSKTCKKYLIEKHGHKCQICGISEWKKGPVPLVLDHIDGDSDNWKFSNLRLVCRNCDGELDTFSGRNKKNLKAKATKRSLYRKERYDNGLRC